MNSRLSQEDWQQGYHGLATLCRSFGMETSRDLAEVKRQDPAESLVVVLGTISSSTQRDLENFVEDGGALLVASDRSSEDYIREFGIEFVSGPPRVRNQQHAFRGFLDCPIATEFSRRSPIVQQVGEIATNCPGRLRLRSKFSDPSLSGTELVYLPASRFPGSRWNTQDPLLAASVEFKSEGGRAVFLADQSILANQMLVYLDNARFSANVISWLSQHPEFGRRKRVVVISDGRSIQPLDPGGLDIQPPPVDPRDVLSALQQMPPEALVEFGNEVAKAAEDTGIANEVLKAVGDVLPSRAIWTLLILVGTSVLCALVFRTMAFSNTNDRNRSAQRSLWETAASQREQESYDRFTAAHELLNEFRQWLELRSGEQLGHDLSSLVFLEDPGRTRLLHQRLTEFRRKMSRFRSHEWSATRLSDLDALIDSWKHAYELGLLKTIRA